MRKRLLSLGLIMVLCFSLTGCKSSDYKKAVELQNSGDYAGALELFKGIGDDYKDVSDRATECQSFIDSITAFDEAKSLLDDKNAELDKAISEANDLVNGENTALDESLRSLLETKISETKAIKITAPTMAETVKEIDTQTTEMNTTDYSDALNDFASKTKDYQEAKDKFWEHLKESSQGLFKRNIVDSVKTIANDLSSDFKDVQHSKDKMDAKEKELDQLSSEQILKYVINSYKVNIDDAQEKLSMHLDEYWRKKELDFKRALILQITNTDALSDSQREEIADMIQNYDVNNFKEQADSVFVRKRFLKGNLLGIRINDDEKLDIKRLARSYNDRIKRIVNDMSQSMNEDCFSQFKIWEEKLLAKINANLTELNPELKSLAEIIRIETENITELENNQTMIQASLDTIKDLMSWKEAEEE